MQNARHQFQFETRLTPTVEQSQFKSGHEANTFIANQTDFNFVGGKAYKTYKFQPNAKSQNTCHEIEM